MITRWCCSCSCVRRAKAGWDRAVYESAWPFLSSSLLLCSYQATWTENVWECESLHLHILYNKLNKWAQNGVHGFSFVLWCVLQSLLMVIVGFTFPDDQVPTDFIPLGRLAGGDRRIISRLANWPFLPTFAWPERYFFKNCWLSCDPCMHSTTRAQFLSMFAQRMSSRKLSRFFHPRSQVSFWNFFHQTFGNEENSWVTES